MIFYFYLKRQLIYESCSHASCNWSEPVDPVVGPTPSYHTWSQGPGWVHTGAWGSRMYQQYLSLPYYSPVRGMANRRQVVMDRPMARGGDPLTLAALLSSAAAPNTTRTSTIVIMNSMPKAWPEEMTASLNPVQPRPE